MDGVHDMGGMHGFGPVEPEPEAEEPVFHADWEAHTFALQIASGSHEKWTVDVSRHSQERLPPAQYLASSYYERWLAALCKRLVETGLVSAEELASGRATGPAEVDSERVLHPEAVETAARKGRPAAMSVTQAPRFTIGDSVRALNIHPTGHTRIPRYVRGHVGEVVLHHGGHVYPDAGAQGERRGEHLYTVAFRARELFGEDASAVDTVRGDLWEPYLEPT